MPFRQAWLNRCRLRTSVLWSLQVFKCQESGVDWNSSKKASYLVSSFSFQNVALLENRTQLLRDFHGILLSWLGDDQPPAALQPSADLLGALVLQAGARLARALWALCSRGSSPAAGESRQWSWLPRCHVLILIPCLPDNHWQACTRYLRKKMVFLTLFNLRSGERVGGGAFDPGKSAALHLACFKPHSH